MEKTIPGVFNLNQALWTPVKTVGKVLFRREFYQSHFREFILRNK